MNGILPLPDVRTLVLSAVLGLGCAAQLPAVTLGQVEDFENGDSHGWGKGATIDPPPVVVTDGGPAGAGDHFLSVTSTGGPGPGGKLVMFNRAPGIWSGDYLAEGITSLQMDLRNLGNEPLDLRLAFSDLFGETGTWFVSSLPVLLGASSDWVTVDFPIESGDLTRLRGSAEFDGVMSNVRSVRFLSNDNPSFRGDQVAATVGLDNITAVPEPSGTVLAGLGALMLLRRRRRCA